MTDRPPPGGRGYKAVPLVAGGTAFFCHSGGARGADLSFGADTPPGLGTCVSSTVLSDIDGRPRKAANAYPGAFTLAAPAGEDDWILFE